MSTRSPKKDVRYTVMLVPERGQGDVRQLTVSTRRVRQAVTGGAAVVLALLLLVVGQAAFIPRALDRDTLAAENASLKARLAEVDARIAELSPMVERVRAYDERLRQLESQEALPGFGPLDAEDAAVREAWIDGVVGVPKALRADAPTDIELASVEARLEALSEDVDALSPSLDDWQDLLARIQAGHSVLPQIWPVEGAVLTSPFGYRVNPFGHQWKMHTGLDLGVPYGSPIFATNDGLVTFSGWDQGHGYTVVLDHGHDVTSRYCHASRLLVQEGDQVSAGEIIALVGSTGMSTGPHLHYELLFDGEKVDPLQYLP